MKKKLKKSSGRVEIRNIWEIPEPYATGINRQILSVSLDLILKKGFGNVSISQIAAQMGHSKQRILYYYSSTDDVLLDLARIWGQIGRNYTAHYLAEDMSTTAQEKVVTMLNATFSLIEKFPAIMGLFPVLSQSAAFIPGVAEIFQGSMDGGVERLKKMISHMPELKHANETSLSRYAKGLHFIMLGAVYYSLSTGSQQVPAPFKKEVTHILRSYLESIARER